jgi:glycosyltransferase involved in cell wall biosynthesis
MTEQRYTELGEIQSPLGGDHAAEGKRVPVDSTLDRVRRWILYHSVEHVHGPQEVTIEPDELVLLCLARDGRPYVRSFVEHYASMGVKHLVFLDNGSTDGTVEALQKYDDVTVLRTRLPFRNYQLYMRRYLIGRFGKNRWSLTVDMDELFDYPYSDVVDLGSLLRYLNNGGYTAVVAQMLDMFPEKPLSSLVGNEGEPADTKDEPLKELHRFYDISGVRVQDYYPAGGNNNVLTNEEIKWFRDGIKTTLFGHRAMLSKHPLVFFDDKIIPVDGTMHRISNARVADFTCVLFHYKLLDRLYEQALRAVAEKNYPNRHEKYEKYVTALEQNPELQIKQETARELNSVNDLVENQFLAVSGDYMVWVDAEEEMRVVDAMEGEPRRFAEAYFKARVRVQTLSARRLQRQIRELQIGVAKERRKRQALERRNNTLELQLQAIQNSRSWKVMKTLSYVRSKVLRR